MTRIDFADRCNQLDVKRAVEIGTDRGIFAATFLARFSGEILYTVDTWEPYEEMPWDRTPDLLMAVHLLAPFRERVKIVRTTSLAFAQAWPYHPPGFVYIDAGHDFESVAEDITAWWPLIGAGGILAGHDYMPQTPGVQQAVDAFAEQQGLSVQVTDGPAERDHVASWWIQKPRAEPC